MKCICALNMKGEQLKSLVQYNESAVTTEQHLIAWRNIEDNHCGTATVKQHQYGYLRNTVRVHQMCTTERHKKSVDSTTYIL